MRSSSWIGIGLILVGLTIFLDRLDLIHFGVYPVVWFLVAAFGIVQSIDGFGRHKSGRVFWGTSLFLFATYLVLRHANIVELRSYWMFPALLVIIGLSLAVTYVSTPRDWHLLIPSALLLGTGVTMIMTEFGYFYRYDVIHAFRVYWPIGLILFGLALVASRISPRS
jgi:hypothetical protein